MGIIYLLSAIPGTLDPGNEVFGIIYWVSPGIQNLLHIPLYGGLAWLWRWSLSGWIQEESHLFWIPLLLTTIFGLNDEWHQLHVPGRYFSLSDIALNIAGALFGLFVYARLKESLPCR